MRKALVLVAIMGGLIFIPRVAYAACEGVQVWPTQLTQALIDGEDEGTTFCIRPGTHHIATGGLEPKEGMTFLGKRLDPAVLTGDDSTTIAFENTADNVVLQDLIVEHFESALQQPAIRAGTGWMVRRLEVRYNNGSGINIVGTGPRVQDSYIHHQGQIGMSGSGSVDAEVINNEIAYNNTDLNDAFWEAGGTKFTDTTNLLIQDNWSHHNNGPGFWTDIDNIGTTYDGNLVEENISPNGTGILHEISFDAVISNNTVRDNDHRGIYISSSGGFQSGTIEVYGNTVYKNPTSGIALAQSERDALGYVTRNVHVYGNTVTMCAGYTGAFEEGNPTADVFNNGNTFEGNDYFVDTLTNRWKWAGADRTFAVWQGTPWFHDDTAGGGSATVSGCP